MSDRIKKIKIKQADGTYSDYIPIGANAKDIDLQYNDSNVENTLKKKPYYYDNVATMKLDDTLREGDTCVTLGYYEINDGGGATYKIIDDSSLEDDGGSIHELNNGLKAELVIKDNIINILQFGIEKSNPKFNEITNVYESVKDISNIILLILNKFDQIYIPDGNYFMKSTVTINKKVHIFGGNNTNIYVNPILNIANNKAGYFVCFRLTTGADNSIIENINIYSKNVYLSDIDNNATSLISGVTPFENNQTNDNTFRNLKGYCTNILSIDRSDNITITDCYTKDSYIAYFAGGNTCHNLKIINCEFNQAINTDIYAHNIYLGYKCENVLIKDCILIQEGEESSNNIKVGSNDGESTDVVVKDCYIKTITNDCGLYIHENSSLSILNCKLEVISKKGYARIMQFNKNSRAYFKNCDINVDSLDKFTQLNSVETGNELIFDNCNFEIKNSYQQYSSLNFISGSEIFKIKNSYMDFSKLTYPTLFISSNSYNLDLINTTFKLGSNSSLGGSYSQSTVSAYKNDVNINIIGCIFEKTERPQSTVLLQYIKNTTETRNINFTICNSKFINCKSITHNRIYITDDINSSLNDYNLFEEGNNTVIS